MTHQLRGLVLVAAAGASGIGSMGCSDDGGGDGVDAPPTRFITVTVEGRRLPYAGVRVFSNRADGSFMAEATTDTDGRATLPAGASVTAMTDEALTVPIGDGDEVTVSLQSAAHAPPTTWEVAVTAPSAAADMKLYTPCYDLLTVTAATTSLTAAPCGRTAVVAILANDFMAHVEYLATSPTSPSPLHFDDWHVAQPVDVAVTPPDGTISNSVSFYAMVGDFVVQLRYGLPAGFPGTVNAWLNQGTQTQFYERYFDEPPAQVTVQASDFLPVMPAPVPVADASGARAVTITAPAGGYDWCDLYVMGEARGNGVSFWRVQSGPIEAGAHDVIIPAVYTNAYLQPEPFVDTVCGTNIDFEDPTQPRRMLDAAASFGGSAAR